MEIWLDTAEIEVIQQAKQMGLLYGVTTNPSIVARSNEPLEELLEKLLQIQTGPVTVDDAPTMIRQGEALYQFSRRLIIKVPVTGEGLKAIHALSQKKIPTMATVVFEPSQVLLAASAGALYIAPYFSSMCEADPQGPELFKEMVHLLIALERAGLTNYTYEYWHLSDGDRYAAYWKNEKEARYGAV